MIRTTILLTLLTFTSAAYAQNRVSVTQSRFATRGDSVYVELDLGLNGTQVPKNAFVLLTPTIQQGDTEMDLPVIMINGSRRHRTYRRLEALHRQPVGVGQVIDAGAKDAPQNYRYSATVPYEPWMLTANFALREDQCECNGPIVPMHFDLFAQGMQNLNPPVAPPVKDVELNFTVSFKVPNPEPVKTRSESGKAYLDFAVGRAELKPEFKNNAVELDKIGETIRSVKNNPYATITGIEIYGFASPEGTYTANMSLSGRRAVALKDYIRRTYILKESLFKVEGKGEDWSGLDTLVNQSSLPSKEQVLEIIRSTDVFDGREKKLMNLQGGAPYKQMLAELFPKLRRTDYELRYTVIPFTVEQGKKVINTAPENLSLNEMFLIAQSYEAGSPEYNRVFDIAVKVYPGSDIASLNAAANALAVNDLQAAQKHLSQVVVHDAAFENNAGVLAALQGDYTKAEEHLIKAKEGGNAEAAKNLVQIEKLKAARAQKTHNPQN